MSHGSKGASSAATVNGRLKVWIAAVVGSPLALLLGLATRSASADDTPRPPPAPIAPAPASRPPHDCLRRFLSPLDQLAGQPRADDMPASPKDDAKPSPTTIHTETPPPPQGDWKISSRSAIDALRSTLPDGAVVETMIATIPDPIDSGLDYAFDTTLQALRLGAEHGGTGEGPDYAQLYRDRSWLSWRDFDSTGNARPESASCRESTPSLMVFRNSLPRTPRFRILLLVGETPSRGLHVAAMVNALVAARELASYPLANGERSYASSETQIIGPTFSGSASSLRFAIEKWAQDAKAEKPEKSDVPTDKEKRTAAHPAPAQETPSTADRLPPIRIVTGSATGSSLLDTLGPEAGWRYDLDVHFEATTLPAAAVECSYLHLARRLGATAEGASEPGEPTPMPQVAMLHESGTEFGASATPSDHAPTLAIRAGTPTPAPLSCRLRAGVQISFPVHIASLREAYEEADRKEAKTTDGVARATSLPVSLRERHPPLDAQSNPSPKTTYAQDVALAGVLAQISVEKVRHVGIQATDVADAIFLARKIRDIAPDVRLAFFENDALLLHPDFQRDLRGSLVLGPYPFLGSSHFVGSSTSGQRSYAPFENAGAEGTFNAVLAARGWGVGDLFEYTAPSSLIPLPVWHATIGRNAIVPLGVARAVDCQKTIYDAKGTQQDADLLASQCDPKRERSADDWRAFNDIHKLDLKADVPLPRLWLFLFAVFSLAFVVDQFRIWRTHASLAATAMPAEIEKSTDRAADLAIGRTKWLLYASIRTFLFGLAFAYVSYVDMLSRMAMPTGMLPEVGSRSVVELVAIGVSLLASLYLFGSFAKNYFKFVRTVRKSFAIDPFLRTSLPDMLSLTFSASRRAAARTSCAQLGFVALFALVLSCGFAYLAHRATFDAAEGMLALTTGNAVPALTLFVLRTVSLGNGVSPAAPALLCLASVYVWAAGRMARIAAAHSTSRISPNDRESDLVSTPLRLVLYPSHDPCVPSSEHHDKNPPPADGGFTRVERAVANAIWRPIAGPLYVSSAIAVIAIPLLLFALKPLVTIEVRAGTWLLAGGLVVSTSLIGITLLQLIRYWLALEHMLKRTMGHPLGAALSSARPFARESVDDQLSKSPNDLLRLAACGPLFDQLMHGAEREHIDWSRVSINDAPLEFPQLCHQLTEARNQALYASSLSDPAKTADASAELGQCVIKAAAAVTRVLEHAWKGQGSVIGSSDTEAVTQRISAALAVGHDTAHTAGTGARQTPTAPSRTSGEMPTATKAHAADARSHDLPLAPAPTMSAISTDAQTKAKPSHGSSLEGSSSDLIDALSPIAWQLGPGELSWLRECQAFVATVVALLVSRYVRQLRYFLYAMTASIALLLLALSSYPFEPHRLLLTCSWCIVGSVVGAGLWIFIELDRNAVISRLSGTDPGKVTLNGALAVRVFAWVVLPLLGVAATTYPDIANMLYRVVEPFVRTLR